MKRLVAAVFVVRRRRRVFGIDHIRRPDDGTGDQRQPHPPRHRRRRRPRN